MTFDSKGHRNAVANNRPWVTWRGYGPLDGFTDAGMMPTTALAIARTEEEATALLDRRLGAVARVERVNR